MKKTSPYPHGIPPGSSSITPFLAIEDTRRAIEFYSKVFNASVVYVTEMAGTIIHAELELTNGRLQLGAPNPAYQTTPITHDGNTSYSFTYYCEDVDKTMKKAVAAGATVREPVSDFVSGDRYGSIQDPFGVRWSICTRLEELTDRERARRIAEWIITQQ